MHQEHFGKEPPSNNISLRSRLLFIAAGSGVVLTALALPYLAYAKGKSDGGERTIEATFTEQAFVTTTTFDHDAFIASLEPGQREGPLTPPMTFAPLQRTHSDSDEAALGSSIVPGHSETTTSETDNTTFNYIALAAVAAVLLTPLWSPPKGSER